MKHTNLYSIFPLLSTSKYSIKVSNCFYINKTIDSVITKSINCIPGYKIFQFETCLGDNIC